MALVFLVHTHVFAANKSIQFSGKVTDAQTQNPIAGAVVSIPELRLAMVTDENGDFIFDRIARKGRVLVEVSFVGYKTIIQTVDLGSTSPVDFALSHSTIEMEEAVVIGTPFKASQKRNSNSVQIISHDELLANPSSNIVDAISHVPGVSQITTGNGVSKPVIRGLGYNRVVTVVNGVKQEENQFGDEHGVNVDQYSVGRVEILRGASSLLYGSDALGGVVNIEMPVPAPDAEGRMHAELASNYSTNNGLTANSLMIHENRNNFSYRVHGTYKNAYSFKTPDGYYPNSGYRETNLDGQVGINRRWGFVHAGVATFYTRLGFYDPENIVNGLYTKGVGFYANSDFTSRTVGYPQHQIRHTRVAINSNIDLGKGKLKTILGYQRNLRREIPVEDVFDSPALFLDLATWSYNVQYAFPEKKGWEPILGVSGAFQNADNTNTKGTLTILPSYTSTELGLFAYLKKSWVNTTLNGGIRWDYRFLDSDQFLSRLGDLRFSAFTHTFNNLSGALGMTHEFDKQFSFKANAGTAFRGPNIAELASNGAHEGTNRFERGDQNLKPEHSYQVDASFAYDSDLWRASVGGFLNQVNNYIYTANFNKEIDLGTGLPLYRFVQTDAVLRGIEASLTLHPVPYIHFENDFSYTIGKNKALDKPLPMIPAANLRNELKFEPTIKGLSKSYVSVGLDNYFDQTRVDDTFESSTAGYSLINLGVGTTIGIKRQQLSVYVAAKNLANRKYYNHLSRLKPGRLDIERPELGILNPGLNVTFGIIMPLSIKRW